MELWKEKNRRRAAGRLFLCMLIFMGLTVFMNMLVYQNYCRKVNTALASMLSEIRKQYPLVAEEALVSVLNGNGEEAEVFLEDFGIESGTVNLLKDMEQGCYESLGYFLPLMACSLAASFVVMFFYFREEHKRIGEITEYIQAIHQRKYDLCLMENEEGEISRLKNELYKITVMLKEQAENSRQEKEAMKDSLADISHQMKTPMTSVLLLLDNLREHTDMPEAVRREFLSQMNRQLQWVNALVLSLLKLSRLTAGVVEMKREKIFLYEFFEEIRENLRLLAEVRNVTVSVQENREIVLWGDAYWEREAFTNLLKNALEHTPAGKEVRVSFEENYFYTKVVIEDEGEGMDEGEQRHIFERFYRGKYSTEGGVGIGLSLAKKIVERDGGTVRVMSELGKGTVFVLRYGKEKEKSET